MNRKRAWEIVEVARQGDRASRLFDVGILTLIFLNVIAVVIGSVRSVRERWGLYLDVFEVFSVAVFTLEYATRVWACTANDRYREPIRGRIRFAFTPMAIIDLLAFLPFYLPFVGFDLRSMRVLRLLRVFRIAKMSRYYSSMQLIRNVLRAKREGLVLSSVIMLSLLVMASSVLYYLENPVQPDTFSSIPATMWWAVATLTTVGYGDMYPVTAAGKFFAGVIAVLGIGMFALPTGILGAGFVEEIGKRNKPARACPFCGRTIPPDDDSI